jgi:plasmid stabilization system protein ParE
MDFKVVFKESFIHDLGRIVRSIASQNPNAASSLGNLIVDRCESLSFFPERHPKVRQRSGIRRFVVYKSFKVFYRVRTDVRKVEILRCWDGRRDGEPGTEQK